MLPAMHAHTCTRSGGCPGGAHVHTRMHTHTRTHTRLHTGTARVAHHLQRRDPEVGSLQMEGAKQHCKKHGMLPQGMSI